MRTNTFKRPLKRSFPVLRAPIFIALEDKSLITFFSQQGFEL